MQELIYHLPSWDSGPLSDDVAAIAVEQLAAMIGEEERARAVPSGCLSKLCSPDIAPITAPLWFCNQFEPQENMPLTPVTEKTNRTMG